MTHQATTFAEPEPHGFIYLGFHAEEPSKVPVYHQTPARRREAGRLRELAESIRLRPEVASARVFRTHLVPPIAGAPRHDLAMLVRSRWLEDLDYVRASNEFKEIGGAEVLVGRNAARIGDTEADEDATFLFNHFTVAGDADPVRVWRGLTDWYTTKLEVDNSTALQATQSSSMFGLVNYVRLPGKPPGFLLGQLLRPSFHRIVRGTLKDARMRALPGFYRLVR